jgi:restriction endonuclease
VFVICALKHSDNTISRRQEVGRGLRLSVNQNGDRISIFARDAKTGRLADTRAAIAIGTPMCIRIV